MRSPNFIRPFDVIALVLALAFLAVAIGTPTERYDILGARTWPLIIAACTLLFCLINLLERHRIRSANPSPVFGRAWLFIAINVGFLTIAALEHFPFFLVAGIAMTFNNRVIEYNFRPLPTMGVLALSLVFCLAVQQFFTSVVYVDLK